MKLALAAALLALSTPALAEGAAPFVHVENEVGTHVVVEHVGGELPRVVCVAPCDTALDAGVYRLRSDTFRTSNVFRIRPVDADRKIDVRIEPRTNARLVASIALMSVSGAFATAAGFLFAWPFLDDETDARTFGIGLGVPMAAVSLALGIPGAAMLFGSIESRACTVETDRLPAGRYELVPRATGFSAPLLGGTF